MLRVYFYDSKKQFEMSSKNPFDERVGEKRERTPIFFEHVGRFRARVCVYFSIAHNLSCHDNFSMLHMSITVTGALDRSEGEHNKTPPNGKL